MADRTIRVVLEAAIAQFRAGMQGAGSAVRAFGVELAAASVQSRRHQESFTLMAAAAAGAGSALLLGLGSAGKAAMEFESSFAGVRKTVDATEKQFGGLSEAFKQLSTEIPVSVNELNRIGELGGQLNVPQDALLDFTKTVAILGATTDLSTEQAATAFAQLATVLETPQDAFDNMAASVVALGNNSAATESGIVSMSQRIAAAGKIAGFTAADVFGFATALSSVGIEAEAGGTAMSTAIIEIANAVASGGKNLESFAKVAHMNAAAFQDAFRTDPAKAVGAFINGLRQVTEEGGNVFGVLEDLGLNEKRLRNALLSMAEAGDIVADSLGLAGESFEAASAHLTEAEKRFATFESRMEIAKNKIELARIALGNIVLQGLTPVVGAVGAVAEAFGELPAPVQAVTAVLTGVTGATLLGAGAFLFLLPRIDQTIQAYRTMRPFIDAARASVLRKAAALRVLAVSSSQATLSTNALGASMKTLGGVAAAAVVGAGIGTAIDRYITTPLAEAEEGGNKLASTIFTVVAPQFKLLAALGRLSGGAGLKESFFPAGEAETPFDNITDALDQLARTGRITRESAEGIVESLSKMKGEGLLTAEAIERLTSAKNLAGLRAVINEGGDVEGTLRGIASGDIDFGKTTEGMAGMVDTVGELDDETKAAVKSLIDLGVAFATIKENQLGTTSTDELQDLNDQLADAHDRLLELRGEADKPIEPTGFRPGGTWTKTIRELQKEWEEEKRRRADERRKESDDEARDRSRDIARTEREIAQLEDKLAKAKRGALQVLSESTSENRNTMQGFFADLTFLASNGQEILAAELHEMGPAAADAARQAVDAIKSGRGLGSLPDDMLAIARISTKIAKAGFDEGFDKYPANFKTKGQAAGEAFGEGVAEGMLRVLNKQESQITGSVSVEIAPTKGPSSGGSILDGGILDSGIMGGSLNDRLRRHGGGSLSGGLASDEVPFIGQRGEYVSDRDTVSHYGGPAFFKALKVAAKMHDGGVVGASVASVGARSVDPGLAAAIELLAERIGSMELKVNEQVFAEVASSGMDRRRRTL